LMHLYNRSDRFNDTGQARYRIVLQIHDAILFEVRIEDIEWVIDTVIPWAMTDMVEINQCDYDGDIVKGSEVYHMGTDRSVYLHWGASIDMETAEHFAIPKRFAKAKKK